MGGERHCESKRLGVLPQAEILTSDLNAERGQHTGHKLPAKLITCKSKTKVNINVNRPLWNVFFSLASVAATDSPIKS